MTDDCIKRYLAQVGKYPLLRPEEELALAQRVEAGCPKAKELLLNSNLRLVVSVAKKYLNNGVPLEDLIQEGNIGMYRAVEKFKPSKGYKFSTYAYWWIRQAVARTVANQSRSARLPIHIQEKWTEVRKAKRKLETELGRSPTTAEICECMGLTREVFSNLAQHFLPEYSMQGFVGANAEASLESIIGCASNHEEVLYQEEVSGRLRSIAKEILTPAQYEILFLAYELGSCRRGSSIQEAAVKLNLSNKEARTLKAAAMRKMRNPSVLSQLESLL